MDIPRILVLTLATLQELGSRIAKLDDQKLKPPTQPQFTEIEFRIKMPAESIHRFEFFILKLMGAGVVLAFAWYHGSKLLH